ncbi:histidine kinase [Rhizorhabdus dicambivorans]|uniref:histidine kinase n=1 Tax=Rhizorhabdus dicambivorans TaxID=1850238 RepID=UPI001596B24A|nr:histidine kinase [Rhizorhabdus dicambivorans]
MPIQALLLRVFLPAVALVAIGLGVLTYSRLYDAILDGFNRKLIAASALTGALIDARDHDRLIAIARTEPKGDEAERSPEYLRAVLPMRRIREKLDITYLYTQVLGGSQDIIYVLDATTGEDHSQIGSEDDLPPETLAGIRRVQAMDGIHLSPIEFQQQWGLLKTAAAPLRDAEGRIVATAGADVNVSLIRTATQNALFASVVIGMVSLLACTLATLLIVRRIAQPLDRLRREALRIAGGDHRPIEPFPAPRDIAALQRTLAEGSAALTGQLAEARAAARAGAAAAGMAAVDAELARSAATPQLLFEGDAGDADAPLRRAAAARLAARAAADPALAARIERDGPPLRLAAGERASAVLDDGRHILIGTGA